MTAITTVKASVNAEQFIKNMRLMFASSKAFVGEALQNARRAGAELITVKCVDGNLVIQDDGQGIQDFQTLLTMCASAWSKQIQESDKPYGMGVSSYFFAAQKVIFESRGKKVEIDSEAFLNGQTFEVQDCGSIYKGTRVSFIGLNDKSLREYPFQVFHRLVLGFPVRVIFNEIELKRPHALDQSFIRCEKVAVKFEGDYIHLNNHGSKIRIYLQGLPVGVGMGDELAIPVHLLGDEFEAVMPDRAMLYNHDDQYKLISAAVHKHARQWLNDVKAKTAPEKFVGLYYEIAAAFGAFDLFNDVDFIDSRFVHQVEADANCCSHRGSIHSMCESDFKDGSIKLFKNVAGFEYNVILVPLMEQHGWLSLMPNVDPGHWLHKYAIDANQLQYQIHKEGECTSAESYHGNTVEMYERLSCTITGPNGLVIEADVKDFIFDVDGDDGYVDVMHDGVTCLMSKSIESLPTRAFINFDGSADCPDEDEEDRLWNALIDKLKGNSNFAGNLQQLINRTGVVSPKVGALALVQSCDQDYAKTINLDDLVLSSIAAKLGCTVEALEDALASSF